VGFGGLMANN
jgi:hypothetical protein